MINKKLNSNNFGKNLGNILTTFEISQTDFARAAGFTQAALSQIINGKGEPSLKSICLILSILPVKFERLLK